jgi:hypothetical protein
MNRRDLLIGAASLLVGCDGNMAQQFATKGQSLGQFAGYDGTIMVGANGNLVNGHGTIIQPRGANILTYVTGMIQGVPFNNKLSPSGVADASQGLNVNDQQGTDNSGTLGNAATVTAVGPNPAYMSPWKMNCIRIGLNESIVLGGTWYQANGTARTPNNFGSFTNLAFFNQLDFQIQKLNSIGCYVILTLAFTNPGRALPGGQDTLANQDNSIQCWQAVAARYGYPNGTALKRNGGIVDDRSVIFELFNEPVFPETTAYVGGFRNAVYFNTGILSSSGATLAGIPVNTPTGTFTPGEAFTASNGTAGTIYDYYVNTTTGYDSSGTKFLHCFNLSGTNTSGGQPSIPIPMPVGTTITGSSSAATATVTATVYPGQVNAGTYGYYAAGNLQMLAAIRAAGAGNVVFCSGTNFAHLLTNWLTNMGGQDATAPAGWHVGPWTSQIGAHWHPYPPYCNVTAATPNAGGSGYAVNDTVLLTMDESGGPNSGTCYWQSQLKVTSIGGGGSITGCSVVAGAEYGLPGVNGATSTPVANAGQFNLSQSGGTGAWYTGAFSGLTGTHNGTSPYVIAADSGTQPGTSGTGATFNCTMNNVAWQGGGDLVDWASAALPIKTAGYPVCITETGEHVGTGIVGSPYMAYATAQADAYGFGFVCFAWVPLAAYGFSVNGCDFYLNDGTLTGTPQYRKPSSGYGAFMYPWFTNHAT